MPNEPKSEGRGFIVWLPLAISTAAFMLSFLVAYFSFFRVSDDLRMLAGGTPYLRVDEKSQSFEMPREHEFTFINAGTRAVSINSIFVRIAQPSSAADAFEKNCKKGDIEYRTYTESQFVIRPGEIIHKSTILYERFHIDISGHTRNATLGEQEETPIPLNKANKSLRRPRYQMCFEVAITTPDTDYDELEAYEIEADASRDPGDYATDIASKRPPIQLLKQTKTIFWDW